MDMQKPDSQLEILKQLYSALSDERKQEFLNAIVEKATNSSPKNDSGKMSLDEFLQTRKYENGRPTGLPTLRRYAYRQERFDTWYRKVLMPEMGQDIWRHAGHHPQIHQEELGRLASVYPVHD